MLSVNRDVSGEEVVLLTGATGVLGGRILVELLRNTNVNIRCLVRADSSEQGRERLAKILRVYDPQCTLGQRFADRVQVVLGDITDPNLGLKPAAFQELSEGIGLVIHSAANTNLFARYRTVEAVNVAGTREIIKFTLACRQAELLYVSTYTVMGNKTFDGDFTFYERDYDVGQKFPFMTYQQSKFVAEGLVRAATRDGLRWQIVRPGQIFGETGTCYYPQGETNVSGLFYDIFKTVTETGVAFHSKVLFDVTPVDYVSKATVALALQHKDFGQTFHLTNPDAVTYSDVIKTVAEQGYDIQFVTQEEYKQLLQQRRLCVAGQEYQSHTTQAFRCWFRHEEFDFSTSARTDCEMTRRVLENYGIDCAPIRRLVRDYVRHGVETKYFPALRITDNKALKARPVIGEMESARTRRSLNR